MLLSSRADATQNFTIPPLALASHVFPRDIEPFLVLLVSDRTLYDSTSFVLYCTASSEPCSWRLACLASHVLHFQAYVSVVPSWKPPIFQMMILLHATACAS